MTFAWNRFGKRATTVGMGILFLCAACVVQPDRAEAQISFGKMRDASEKNKNAPKVDDEESEGAFDVDPNEKPATKDAAKPAAKSAPKSNEQTGAKTGAAKESAATTASKPAARNTIRRRTTQGTATPTTRTTGANTPSAKQTSANAPTTNPNLRADAARTSASKRQLGAGGASGNVPSNPNAQRSGAANNVPNDADEEDETLDPADDEGLEADVESEEGNDDEKGNDAARKIGAKNATTPNGAKSEKTDATVDDGTRGPILGKAVSHKYRAGMIFGAQPGGSCSNVLGTAPVPMEFPEQKVRTLEEDFPRVAKVDYRDLKEGGARQLVFRMRELKSGQSVEATALFEVTRYPILPPTAPELYRIPKSPTTDVRRYLKSGPYIESTSKTVRSLAKETTENVEGDWDKVDAILSFVRENIQYKEVMIEKPMRGALAAIKTGDGDCEDMSALFIAMCRAIDVPARLVRVPGHCWAEFYLIDDDKNGYWFPAQVAGTEPLGSMQDTRVILQKGDNFRLPESPKEESLYVKELFTGSVKENSPDPIHQFIQEMDGQ